MQRLWFWRTRGSKTLSLEKPDDTDLSWTNLDKDVPDSCLVGYSGWIVLTSSTQFVICSPMSAQLPLRDEINIKRLLRYLIRNPACNMNVGCNLGVPGIVGSVVVLETSETIAAILELQFRSKDQLKTHGLPCMRPPTSRTRLV